MTRVWSKFTWIVEALSERIGRVASYLIFLIMLITTAEVVSRYVFNYPTAYAWPINRQLFGIFILFAGTYTMKEGGHIRIEIFYQHFPPLLKRISRAIGLGAFLIFIGVLVWQSAWMGLNSLDMMEKVAGGFRMPLYPFKLLIPVAAFLFFLEGIVSHLKK
jgi:TRAP-type mannitol/chloroaromatic compound transport system permease small subunit